MSDLTLLDVFAAHAREGVRDGLVLIGDAVHTHGPIGAQGINLALQDAAALNPVLLDALAAGQPTRERLAPYARLRVPAAALVHRMQRMQAKAVFGGGNPVAGFLRARAAALVTHTRLGALIIHRVAYGTGSP